MNNLQFATTLVAPTGTGLLYTAYDQGSDSAIWKNGGGAGRSLVSLSRVQPKPTPTFAGVERFEFKRYQYRVVAQIEYVSVITLSASIPMAVALADRQESYLHAALMAADPIFKNAIELGTIPT